MRWAASATVADSRRDTGAAGDSTPTVSLNTAGLIDCSSSSSPPGCSSSASCSCMRPSCRGLLPVPPLPAGELLRIPHVRPGPGLHVPQDLPDVVAVVVHPLLEKIVHAEPAHLGVLAAPREIARLEPAHERRTLRAHVLELRHELGRWLQVVAAPASHLLLVPALELRVLGSEKNPDAPREATA